MNLNDAMKWLETHELQHSKETSAIENRQVCFITKEPIKHEIQLKCMHCFEYDAILNHLLVTQKSLKYHICPYCRKKHDLFIPYYESTSLKNINPTNRIFSNNYLTCVHIFKHGSKKGTTCTNNGHCFSSGNYCFTHHKQIEKKQQHTHTDEICTQILKNGKPCKCKIYDKTTKLCKRHFNLKNKQLNITSL